MANILRNSTIAAMFLAGAVESHAAGPVEISDISLDEVDRLILDIQRLTARSGVSEAPGPEVQTGAAQAQNGGPPAMTRGRDWGMCFADIQQTRATPE